MSYQVFDNDKPAEYPNSKFPEWHNSRFDTFQEAIDYAKFWFGIYFPPDWKGDRIDYSGFSDYAEIRVVD